ncbi:unnamed protein product [Clavelina lepadiformis]|uniref:Metalloendopeptidase n=1 Tax=Clavelina lepadiformis TaxID=159417 RepID=A0ABP0FEW2_CLALP
MDSISSKESLDLERKESLERRHRRRSTLRQVTGFAGPGIVRKVPKQRDTRLGWLIAFSTLALGVAGGLGYAIYHFATASNPCSSLSSSSEYDILLCERVSARATCDFDISQCSTGCAMGFEQDEFLCPRSCDCALEGAIETDVTFNPNNIQTVLENYRQTEDNSYGLLIGANRMLKPLWDRYNVSGRYRVPYVYASNLNNETRQLVREAISSFLGFSCIDFYPWNGEADFIEFIQKGHGCKSFVGRIGGRQLIELGPECRYKGMIVHEIMHALGFWHEQSRPDRDNYVTMQLENVDEEYHRNFLKRTIPLEPTIDLEYDVNSIMHSDGYLFSKTGYPTIVYKHTSSAVVAHRTELSEKDIEKLNRLYSCTNNLQVYTGIEDNDHWSDWSPWLPCSSSCGEGQSIRTRECLDEADRVVYRSRCAGEYHEVRSCERPSCLEGLWGSWSTCSVSCGGGVKHRSDLA